MFEVFWGVERRRQAISHLPQEVRSIFLRDASSWTYDDIEQRRAKLEDVQGIVRKNGTPAFKLIEMGILLDSQKPIPRQKLKQLHKDVEKDLVASRLLQIMVLNRLYMFRTTEQDMQWLKDELDIDLGIQHAITYQERKRRMINGYPTIKVWG